MSQIICSLIDAPLDTAQDHIICMQSYLYGACISEIVNSQTNFEKIKVWLCSQLYNDLALLGNKASANSMIFRFSGAFQYKDDILWIYRFP